MTTHAPHSDDSAVPVLLVRARDWLCALPLANVEETCRPLKVQPLDAAPEFVQGLTIIRGKTAPVLHLGTLLSGSRATRGLRFVSVNVLGRAVVLEVDEAIGVRYLPKAQLDATQSLLSGVLARPVNGLTVLDGELLAWLDTTRIIQQEALDRVLGKERA